jgi:hypothetical protein
MADNGDESFAEILHSLNPGCCRGVFFAQSNTKVPHGVDSVGRVPSTVLCVWHNSGFSILGKSKSRDVHRGNGT